MTRRNPSALLSAIAEASPEPVFSLDRAYRFTSFNAAFAGYIKKARGTQLAVGAQYFDSMPESPAKLRARKSIDAAFKGKTAIAEPDLATSPARGSCYRWTYVPLRSRSGRVIGVGVSGTDVRRQVRTEKELILERERMSEEVQESATMFRFVFENAYDGISLFEENADPRLRRLIECNERYAELAGRSREELLKLGHTLQIARVIRERNIRSTKSGTVFSGAFSWLRPDKRDNVVEYTAVSIKVRDKTLSIGIDRDVTRQRRAEEQLERNLRETRVRLDVSQALAGKESETEVLDALIQHAGLSPHVHVAIVTFDAAAGEGVLRRSNMFEQGRDFPLPLGTRFPESRYTAIRQYAEGRPFIVDDVDTDERLDPHTREMVRLANDRSYAVFPFMANHEWLGWIAVSAAKPAFFGPELQHLYAALAGQGAVALHAARLREAIRESQQRLALLVQQSPLAVIEWDTEFQARSWNAAAERIFGYRREDAVGRPAIGLIIPEDVRPMAAQIWEALMTQQGGTHSIKENVTSTGRRISCEWFNAPLVASEGQVIGVVSLIEDISERKRAEEALQLTSFALQRVADAVYWMDQSGRIVDVNEAACRTLGYAKHELIGMTLGDIDPNWSPARWPKTWEGLREKGTLTLETLHRCKDGRTFSVEIVANFIQFGGRELDCALARDITQRKEAEQALRASEHLLQEAQRVAHMGHYSLDAVSGMWTGSEILDEVFGIDQHFVRDVEGWLQIVHPQHRQEMGEYFTRVVLQEHRPFDREYKIVRASDRQVRWVHGLGKLEFDEAGRLLRMIGTIQDITERKNADEALRQSEEQYRAIVNAVPDILFRVNGEGIILDYSAPDGSRLYLPPDQFLGRGIKDVMPPQVAEPASMAIAKALRSGEMTSFEYELPVGGERRFFEDRLVPLSSNEVLSVIRDITEQKQAEEKIRTSLEEKEFLLKEIHHRVKNNLQIIASMLHLQAEHTTDERILNQFREAQNRVRSIAMVHEKLYRSTNLAEINFSEYLREVIAGLFRAYANPRAALNLDTVDILLGIDVAIPCGLIINELVSNALKYAFPEGKEGTISVTMKAEDQDHIVLMVQDDGVGIPEQFDVFHGDTLGMTVVSVLVQQINGSVELDRSAGTRFTVRFQRTLP